MKPATRHHLTLLDRTIVQLFNERARLVAQNSEGLDARASNVGEVHVDDLLQRSSGPFPAGALREAFSAIERGCREVLR